MTEFYLSYQLPNEKNLMEILSGNDQPTGRDLTMNLKRPPRKDHLFFPWGVSISDPLGHQCELHIR